MLKLSAFTASMPTEHSGISDFTDQSPLMFSLDSLKVALCHLKNHKSLITNAAVCKTDTRAHVTEELRIDFFY